MPDVKLDPFDDGRLTAHLVRQPAGYGLVRFSTTGFPKRILTAVSFHDFAYAEQLVATINGMLPPGTKRP